MKWWKDNVKNVLIVVLLSCLVVGGSWAVSIQQSFTDRMVNANSAAYELGRKDAETLTEYARQEGYDQGYTAAQSENYEKQRKEAAEAAARKAAEKAADQKLAEQEATQQEQQVASSSKSQDNAEPQSVTVYVTNSGTKYHKERCRYLSQSKNAISLEDAKASGYGPCSHCHPPQ